MKKNFKLKKRTTNFLNALIKKGNKTKALKFYENALLKISLINKQALFIIIYQFNYFYKKTYSTIITKINNKFENIMLKMALNFNLNYWGYRFFSFFINEITSYFSESDRKKIPKLSTILTYYFLEEIYFINKLKFIKLNYWFNKRKKSRTLITSINVKQKRVDKDLKVQKKVIIYDKVQNLFSYLKFFYENSKVFLENYFKMNINIISTETINRISIRSLFLDYTETIMTCTNRVKIKFNSNLLLKKKF